MKKTKIEWTDCTINPVIGCTYGCTFCYAKVMNTRFKYVEDFSKPQFFPERLKQLYSKQPQLIFMDSMSDVADWKVEWLYNSFMAMADNPQHKYLMLTKRQEDFGYILAEMLINHKTEFMKFKTPPVYLLIGSSVTTQEQLYETPCSDFYSIEPILEPISVSGYFEEFRMCVADAPEELKFPVWVILGAETGNRKGKIIPEKWWIDNIVKECDYVGIPVFMKNSLLPIMGEENMRREFPKELRC